ncbi:hypothetical protein TNCV_2943331 [Trichonephila clavipes]|nr:hypothetical protein TNCV_2943331 [Trichonephila clavipes]
MKIHRHGLGSNPKLYRQKASYKPTISLEIWYTGGICGGPRNFELRSSNEDDTLPGIPLSKLPHHVNGSNSLHVGPYTVTISTRLKHRYNFNERIK